jgi:transcriptional regulator with XRE-family HTH domain
MILREADTEEFRDRMHWCIRRSGSIYSLAKKIGVFPNTIRGYIRNSEPSRPILVAIARECEVSIEWLATGEGAKPDSYKKETYE